MQKQLSKQVRYGGQMSHVLLQPAIENVSEKAKTFADKGMAGLDKADTQELLSEIAWNDTHHRCE